MLNYLSWSIFNFLSRPPNLCLATRILLPWFSVFIHQPFCCSKDFFPSKVLNHGNWISCCCCWKSFANKSPFHRIWPFSCLLFSGLFQHKEIQRKLYSMSCIGIFWEWMNFWEWFQCLYVTLTFTNVQKPSEYLTTSLCPGLQCSPSIIISCIQFSYVWMVPTRTSIVWTPKLYFCSDDICHEFLKDDLEYILRTERFLRYSCRNIFSPEGCLLRSLLKWINADQGSKLLLYWWKQPREKDRCTFNAVLERCSSREALVGIRFFS